MYKNGDKVVIKIDKIDAPELNKGYTMIFYNEQLLGKLEDFQPVEEKIKMTVEEKEEFDKLKERYVTPYAAMSNMFKDNVPHLFKKVNTHESDEKRAQNQFKFFKAFEYPGLIEVVKEKKYWIKLADGYLVNVMGDWLTLKNKKDGDIFTQSEIDVLQKQEQFKAIDLNKCKEKVENDDE